MIVQFDATIDDVVDVSMRALARSKTLRAWNWQGLLTAALLAGLPLFIVVQGGTGKKIMAGFGAALLAAALYVMTYKGSVEKRVRKLCLAQLGGDKPFRVEVELTESGVALRQLKTQHIYDWSTIVEIKEVNDAIYFYQRDGSGFAVRSRGFESIGKECEFIQLARRYFEAAQSANSAIGKTDNYM